VLIGDDVLSQNELPMRPTVGSTDRSPGGLQDYRFSDYVSMPRHLSNRGYGAPPPVSLTAAVGFWGPESAPEEIGWTEVPGVAVKPGMFVARVTGTSMEPLIPDGSWCLFRPCPAGSLEGRIVYVQFATLGVGENGGRFTVKKYHSENTVTADGWRYGRIQPLPLNATFEPITLEPDDANDLTIVGGLCQND
jgi:hypothetical protein